MMDRLWKQYGYAALAALALAVALLAGCANPRVEREKQMEAARRWAAAAEMKNPDIYCHAWHTCEVTDPDRVVTLMCEYERCTLYNVRFLRLPPGAVVPK